MSATSARPRARHWSLALGAALLLHAALAMVFHELVDGGAAASGRGGIAVGLAPTGGTQGAPESEAVPEAVGAAEVAEAVVDEVSPDVAAEVPPDSVQEAAVASEAPTATVTPGEVPLFAPVETVEVEAPQEETAPVEEAPVRQVMTTPPPPQAKPRRPAEEEETQPDVPQAVEAPPRETAAAAAAEAAVSAAGPQPGKPAPSDLLGNSGKAGIGDRATAGTSEGHSGGGKPGAFVDYHARLLAWLEKHKKYPRRARLRNQEGTPVLHLVIDRSGRVLEYRIEKSSGYEVLDAEAEAMIERASPMPEVPGDAGKDRFVFLIPVSFGLR